MATKEKAKELRHAKTLRKLASEEAAEAAKMASGGEVEDNTDVTPDDIRERKMRAKTEAAYNDASSVEPSRKSAGAGRGFVNPKSVKTYARGGGIEIRGKTKGRFV